MDLETMTMIMEAIDGYEELLEHARGILGKDYLFEPNDGTPMSKIYNLYEIVERFSPLSNGQDESIRKLYDIIWDKSFSYEERAKLVLGL